MWQELDMGLETKGFIEGLLLEMLTLYPIQAKYQQPSTPPLGWRFESRLKSSTMKKTSTLAF